MHTSDRQLRLKRQGLSHIAVPLRQVQKPCELLLRRLDDERDLQPHGLESGRHFLGQAECGAEAENVTAKCLEQ